MLHEIRDLYSGLIAITYYQMELFHSSDRLLAFHDHHRLVEVRHPRVRGRTRLLRSDRDDGEAETL